ncbi:hypothetical protein C1645_835620 [Glomus cerebriforme]|uniref:Uncharacterized protein n=1 Tax=Glomus cerebriforme TaxID=658196 RepID=A0A397SE33_9GLOM|nr:hypothetical protein C1645_835620 [Glomus cerebriforme]
MFEIANTPRIANGETDIVLNLVTHQEIFSNILDTMSEGTARYYGESILPYHIIYYLGRYPELKQRFGYTFGRVNIEKDIVEGLNWPEKT